MSHQKTVNLVCRIKKVVVTAARNAVTQARPRPAAFQQPQLIAACCGFPKDLVKGPSNVQRHNLFGDDACFFARHPTADVMGVADGVGGWRSYGIDPSNFSHTLMSICQKLVEEGCFDPRKPRQLINASYSELLEREVLRREGASSSSGGSKERPILGSSTACIVMLDRESSRIHTANLGDSGFLVLREGRVVHRSDAQQHYFNAPFQLCSPPPTEDGCKRFLMDRASAADTSSFAVREGDLIVLATDGLFDNMPTELIESEIARIVDYDEETIQQVCNSLAYQARRLAFDQNHVSPFSEKARQHGFDAMGGKPGDITVILALVTSESAESATGDEAECSTSRDSYCQ